MKSTGRIAIAKDHIINDMKKIGVAKRDHLAVNLSFKSIGYFIGGPEAFIDALLAAVGSEGTIMMNTYTMPFGIAVIPR
jgi:aminoglycoside 3-N-acetyltransferase